MADNTDFSSGEVTKHDKSILNLVFNPNLPHLEDEDDNLPASGEAIVLNDSEKEAKRLEIEGVKSAEAGDLAGAIELFSKAIETAPKQPSAYNNRAQALRLKGDEQGALEDLDMAIELSGSHGLAATQAYTQRGLLRKKNGDEAGALEDMNKAAALGGKFAKSIVIASNPYAAMCNQMMSEMVRRLREGVPDEED